MKEETQTRPSIEDPSHCKRGFQGETSRQGEPLTAHMLCLGKALALGVNPVACDLWFREIHHSLLIFGSEEEYWHPTLPTPVKAAPQDAHHLLSHMLQSGKLVKLCS